MTGRTTPRPQRSDDPARDRIARVVKRLCDGEELARPQVERLVRRLQHLGPRADRLHQHAQ